MPNLISRLSLTRNSRRSRSLIQPTRTDNARRVLLLAETLLFPFLFVFFFLSSFCKQRYTEHDNYSRHDCGDDRSNSFFPITFKLALALRRPDTLQEIDALHDLSIMKLFRYIAVSTLCADNAHNTLINAFCELANTQSYKERYYTWNNTRIIWDNTENTEQSPEPRIYAF